MEEKVDVWRQLKVGFSLPVFEEVDVSKVDKDQPSLHMLNDECLDLILSYSNIVEICKLGMVCRRWYNACLSRLCRIDYLSIGELKKQLQDKTLTSGTAAPERLSIVNFIDLVSLNHGSLNTLSLIDVTSSAVEEISIQLPEIPNLRVLEFDKDIRFSADCCDTLAAGVIPKLDALSLYAESVPNEASFWKMLRSAQRLKHLAIKEGPTQIRHRTGRHQPRLGLLEALSPQNPLVSCSFYGYINLHPKSLEYIFKNFSQTLEYVNLSSTNLEGLTNMNTRWLPTLKKMKVFLAAIRHHELVEDDMVPPTPCSQELVEVLKLMPNLRVLDLEENHHLKDTGVDIVSVLTEHCPLIEEVNLTNCSLSPDGVLSLRKLVRLKRLFLGEIYDSSSCFGADILDSDWTVNFRNFANQVLPSLSELECASFPITDHQGPPEDIVSFFDNAGPKFKVLSFSALFIVTLSVDKLQNRNDFIENFAKKCKDSCKHRNDVIKLHVHGYGLVHKSTCQYAGNHGNNVSESECGCRNATFDDVAPTFLKITSLVIDEQFDHRDFYPDNISQHGVIKIRNEHVRLPRLTPGHF
ncbi:hypothetical protein ACHWQZ_G008204 [Mnemiopsis leidyi]